MENMDGFVQIAKILIMKVKYFLFKYYLIYIVRIQCNRCGRIQNQMMFNSNNGSSHSLNENNFLRNRIINIQNFQNNINKNNMYRDLLYKMSNIKYSHSYSPKNKKIITKKKRKNLLLREKEIGYVIIVII